jgi:hypothetical protein
VSTGVRRSAGPGARAYIYPDHPFKADQGCGSVDSGSGVPLPFLTASEAASLPGGTYTIDHTRFLASSINLPLLPYLALPTAASGTTPTSGGQVEPLFWGTPAHKH